MNDFKGFVYLHRKLLDNPIFKNQNTLQIFIYCLLKATHKDYTASVGGQFVKLKAGQFVTGRKVMSQDTGMSDQSVRTTINNLKKLEFLTIKSTNRYSVITIVEWDSYQQTNQQPTNSQPHTITSNNNNNIIEVPEGVNVEAWEEWTEYRTQHKKKKITQAAAKKQFKILLAHTKEEQQVIIDKSISGDYQGLFAIKGKTNEAGTGNSGQSTAARTAEKIQREFGSRVVG